MKDASGRRQTMLVIGGTSEIGLAIAREFARRGGEAVVLSGRDPDALAQAAAALSGGVRVVVDRFEALDTDGHAGVLSRATDAVGDLDVVVVAVGVLLPANSHDVHEMLATARVNYVGALSACLEAARVLKSQAHGTLVVLSSVAAARPRRSNWLYGSTKAGLDAAARGLAIDLEGSGASVLVVRPGFVSTRMTEGMKRQPFSVGADDVARAVLDSLDGSATVVWVPGILRYLMALVRLLPQWAIDRLDR